MNNSRLYNSFSACTLNRIAPSFRSTPVFLTPLYKSFEYKTLNATFPFPQVFGLRRLRGNPPCSLWLQSVHWTNCFTRRAHITVPPFREPTVTAWRGTTLSTRIDKCRSLIMPPRFVRRLRNNTAQSLVQTVKLGVRNGRRRCGSNSVFEVAHSVYKCAPTKFS